ncbi:hypothetical protein CONCODRAFT_13075 [Conidiobolus coronatus NRRL 28638]|uniref:Uncharacterized protein n=1 Tax=Conidiobolus coronatus (strain ATCC 28846 / CBS 209.66 / NRRL 28638) TaxID=796925 RepID=A0A137NRK2_CONC2|nr:hypothetical protein CONCODRAFT_13075 [Conidiobolus coronatus NRRL 28638]|eukprot:KXN65358.1 hypothetical protein CONCODRAFT_13075 [Conidiobolus coronatus NRRL 28638]
MTINRCFYNSLKLSIKGILTQKYLNAWNQSVKTLLPIANNFEHNLNAVKLEDSNAEEENSTQEEEANTNMIEYEDYNETKYPFKAKNCLLDQLAAERRKSDKMSNIELKLKQTRGRPLIARLTPI